jgi:hypothetical protein
MRFDPKVKAVRERIKYLENDTVRAKEYLENGKHARWQGFSPLFVHKLKNGEELPPHKDWVKNVFLPHTERSLRNAEKVLARLESSTNIRTTKNHDSKRKLR